jgi:flagellar hook assembly protein FlgD
VQLDVLDLSGRHVRALAPRRFEAGAAELTWDGRDDLGRSAPAGVYWLRVSGDAGDASRRVVLLRK